MTTTNTNTNTTTRPVSMATIRAIMPEYFGANVAGLVEALSRPAARIEALTYALTGAAIERAQSGNMPKSWERVDSVAQSLKGATKTRVLEALAVVAAIKPASVKGTSVCIYEIFAVETLTAIAHALTPPATVKPSTPATNWRAECLTARAECEALQAELAALKLKLSKVISKRVEVIA